MLLNKVYLIVVQRGVIAQGADGRQLNKAIICTAVDLGTSLGTEKKGKLYFLMSPVQFMME